MQDNSKCIAIFEDLWHLCSHGYLR